MLLYSIRLWLFTPFLEFVGHVLGLCPTDDVCCPICLDVFHTPVSGACGHVYCLTCVKRWGLDKPCPLCRQLFTSPSRPRPVRCEELTRKAKRFWGAWMIKCFFIGLRQLRENALVITIEMLVELFFTLCMLVVYLARKAFKYVTSPPQKKSQPTAHKQETPEVAPPTPAVLTTTRTLGQRRRRRRRRHS